MTATVRQPRKTLPGVITKSKLTPPLMCVFGTPGVGKSTFASGAPNPIFVTTENGVDGMDVARFPKATSLAQFIGNLHMVAEGDHDYGAVVIDTLNGLMELYQQANSHNKDFDFVTYGGHSGWNGVAGQVRSELMPLLFRCKERGMYVILLAHTGEYNRKNPLGPDLLVAAPSIAKQVWKGLLGDMDVVGRADFVYSTKDTGKNTGKAKASTDEEVVNGERVKVRQLNFESGAEQDCKARIGYELPPTMPLSWEAFAAHIGNVKALAGEIRDLWHHLPVDKVQTTLQWLGVNGVEQLAEANRSKLSQLRNRLLEAAAAAAQTVAPEAPAEQAAEAQAQETNDTALSE